MQRLGRSFFRHGINHQQPLLRTNARTFVLAKNAREAVESANIQNVEVVNLKFTDLLGTLQQLTIDRSALTEDLFEDGVFFDGSSIRGWQGIEKSDMILKPDPTSAFIDPFSRHRTMSFLCRVYNPDDASPYEKDPKFVVAKCAENVAASGFADYANVGPEAEFYVFDNVSYSVWQPNQAFYSVDSQEGPWNMSKTGNLGYKPRLKEGYFPAAPYDTLNDLRLDMVKYMDELGLQVECAHHEVGAAGQCEIDFKFDEIKQCADKVVLYKYIVRNVAFAHGKTATFLPKPIWNDNGSGMHQHYSLHSADGANLFTGGENSRAGLSDMALFFVGGIMKHAGAICAFTNPTTNSYKRLVPGFEAPTIKAYSSRNRSAFIRVPISHPKGRRIEFRTPDPTCNPYLAFSAIVQAGLDGIKNQLDPGVPRDMNLYDVTPAQMLEMGLGAVPESLRESLDALENDNAFLQDGGVFSPNLIETWIERKREEIRDNNKHPSPYEFYQYYDA